MRPLRLFLSKYGRLLDALWYFSSYYISVERDGPIAVFREENLI